MGVVREDWAEDGHEMLAEDDQAQDKVHSGYKSVGLVFAGVFADVHGSPAGDNLVEYFD